MVITVIDPGAWNVTVLTFNPQNHPCKLLLLLSAFSSGFKKLGY